MVVQKEIVNWLKEGGSFRIAYRNKGRSLKRVMGQFPSVGLVAAKK